MNLIYPWDLDKFEGSVTVKGNVIGDLIVKYRDGFKLLQTQKPSERLMKAVDWVSHTLINKEKSHKVPWLMVISNSTELLQSLATVVPCVVSLTTHKKVFTVNTAQMLELFTQRRPDDPFETDPIGESIDRVKRCGHLCWTEFAVGNRGASKFEGSFHSLLYHRVKQKTHTLFLVPWKAADMKMDAIYKKVILTISQSYGPAVEHIVEEFAQVKMYKVKSAPKDLETEVL